MKAGPIFPLVYLLFLLPWAFSQSAKSFNQFSRPRNNGSVSPRKRTPEELREILSSKESWSRLESTVKAKVDGFLKSILPSLIRQGSHANLSFECQEAVVRTTFALRQLKGWALKILDATGKPPDGMLGGTTSSLGSYSECINTVAYKDENKLLFTGKYCTLLVRPPIFDEKLPRNFDKALKEVVSALKKGEIFGSTMRNFGFLARDHAIRWGVCVPSPCTPNDVENLARIVTDIFGMSAHVPRCEVLEKTVLKNSQIIVFTLLGALTLLILLGTTLKQALPVGKTSQKSCLAVFREALECFCVRNNFGLVLNTNNPNSAISCLHGIRCITMMWIIYGHTYFYYRNTQTYSFLINGYDGVVDNFAFSPIINFTYSVETFFFVSGLLIVYSKWSDLRRTNGRMNYLYFILRRYWRLTPLLGITICWAIIIPLLGDGPLWHEFVVKEAENCERNWWMNILYFNNLVPYFNTCMVVTWYLATNTQFYVISLLFLVPLFKYPRLGIILVFLIGTIGICVTGVVNYMYDLAPAMMFIPNERLLDDVVIKVYHKPYSHIGGFCVGVFSGYILVKRKNHRIRPIFQFVFWLLSISLGLVLLFGNYEWNRGSLPNVLLSSIYAATHRTAWTLSVAWIVYMCATGQGGFLNTLLSWSGFVPLSNLSFACYLIHPLTIIYNLGSRKERVYYDHYNMGYLFCGHLFITIAVALASSLLAEIPFSNLDRLIFRRRQQNSGTANFKVIKPTEKIEEIESTNYSVKPSNGTI